MDREGLWAKAHSLRSQEGKWRVVQSAESQSSKRTRRARAGASGADHLQAFVISTDQEALPMQKSDSISALAAALVLAQPMVEGAKKTANNPHFGKKYADLESVWDAVRPALEAHDLAVTQFPDQTVTGAPALTTILVHKSGQWICGTYPLISSKNDPQGFMSALTYGRRGGISSVMGVLAEDDDGNAASKPPKPSVAPPKQPGGELYAPERVTVPEKPATDRAAAAKSWALGEIHRIKTMDKAALDKFSDRFAKTLAELKTLDSKTSVEIEKAIGDRYTALFD